MSNSNPPIEDSAELPVDRKRILYRANHRGIKEMDIMLGGFAKRHLSNLSEEDLNALVALMDELDRDLIQWFTGELPLPDHLDKPMFERILADHARNTA